MVAAATTGHAPHFHNPDPLQIDLNTAGLSALIRRENVENMFVIEQRLQLALHPHKMETFFQLIPSRRTVLSVTLT